MRLPVGCTLSRFSRSAVLSILAAGLIVSSLVAGRATLASGLRDHAQSLNGVPADAAFYAAWLKNREQFEAMQESNAWKKLMSIPVLQMGLMQAQTQWQFPTDPRLIQFKKWFDSEQGQDVVALATEMVSDEMFVYGDGSLATLLEVVMEMNSEMTRSQFGALREMGDPDALENEDAIQAKLLELLDDHGDDLKVPTIVFGFRVNDAARATSMLDLAEAHLRQLLAHPDVPAWVAEQLERQQIDGNELLTLTVTGNQIPWEEMEEEAADAPELFQAVRELAEDKEMVVAIGVVKNFVVFSISNSIELFKGHGDHDLLADNDEFERLDKHAAENVITIGYASEELMQAVGSQERSFGDIAMMAKGFLSLADLTEDQVEHIEGDIDELADDILDFLPEPGAFAGVTFTTDRGYETFSYNWGGMPANLDASKQLTLVDHLGEDSLGWFVGRGKQSVEGYDKFVGWCKRGFAHFEGIAVQQASETEWSEYQTYRDQALPLLARLDAATRKYMIPGFADGQGAIVFEATAADDNWCDFIPPSNTPLPLPSIAFVYGVSDAGAVKQGAAEYFDIVQAIIDAAHEAKPDEVPAFVLPKPNEASTSVGTIYSYELPGEWGVNDRIAPNAGLSDSVLVLSAMPELSEKLLAGSRPAVDGPAAEFDRPLLSAGHFKFAKLIETTKPWVDYGIQVAVENAGPEGGGAVAAVGFVKPQVDQFLEVVQTIDSYTGVTYREDDAWVTHGELRIIDLED